MLSIIPFNFWIARNMCSSNLAVSDIIVKNNSLPSTEISGILAGAAFKGGR